MSAPAAMLLLGSERGELFAALLPWLVALIAVVVIGGLIAALARHLVAKSGARDEAPLTLEDLRRMHRDGMLTSEEFEAARASLLASFGKPPTSGKADPEQSEESSRPE